MKGEAIVILVIVGVAWGLWVVDGWAAPGFAVSWRWWVGQNGEGDGLWGIPICLAGV